MQELQEWEELQESEESQEIQESQQLHTYGVWILINRGFLSGLAYWNANAIPSSSISHSLILSQLKSITCD